MSSSRNIEFYSPYSDWPYRSASWMGLNDVNIIGLTDEAIVYEYAYLNDGRKWWAKNIHLREPELTPYEQYPDIIREVEAIREVADKVEVRGNGR